MIDKLTGKTTAARLSVGATVLNDDLIAFQREAGGWTVYGTPFWNPTQTKPARRRAPLAALFRLAQSQTVRVEPLAPARALAELVASAPVLPAWPSYSAALLERCQRLAEDVPVRRLHFRREPSFWNLIVK